MAIEHDVITDPNIHEPKGVSGASVGQVYIANGAGSGTWTTPPYTNVDMGFYDYNDAATASTPINLTLANTNYELTNDGLGPFTNKTYALNGVADIWDVGTDRFDFSNLSLGDTVDIRLDIEWTTVAQNTEVKLVLELGVGTGSAYTIPFFSGHNLKTIKPHNLIRWNGIYMGDNTTKNNPARFLAQADDAGTTIKVNGWYARVITRG